MLTRAAIVAASLELGQEVGEDGLTMRALAARLGVSATSLYGVFENKDAIIKELRVGAWERMGETLRSAASLAGPYQRLMSLGREYLRFSREESWLYELAMSGPLPASQLTPDQAVKAGVPARAVVEALRDALGSTADPATIAAYAVELWAGLHGLATARVRMEAYMSDGATADDAFAEAYVDALVRGVGVRPA
jgi:AcrR family transcriptional regulator